MAVRKFVVVSQQHCLCEATQKLGRHLILNSVAWGGVEDSESCQKS